MLRGYFFMKKIAVWFVCLIFILGVWISANQPVFKNYSQQTVVYSFNNSSNAKIDDCNNYVVPFKFFKVGESCVVDKNFNVSQFISQFNASVVMKEQTVFGNSIYLYSPKINYCKSINGKKINLQIFTDGQKITIGTPIIYGSY